MSQGEIGGGGWAVTLWESTVTQRKYFSLYILAELLKFKFGAHDVVW